MTHLSGENLLSPQPILAFAGPFGTGKTEVAINYVLAAVRAGKPTCLVDLDIVTPYFRVGDYRTELEDKGIRVVAPPGALASYETPSLSPEIAGVLLDDRIHSVLDVGGDPSGAQLLGVFSSTIASRGYDLWMVANPFRPASNTIDDISRQRDAIEEVSGLQVTGIVANPHLGPLTTTDIVEQGFEIIESFSKAMRLPIKLVAVSGLLSNAPFKSRVPILSLQLVVRLPWEHAEEEGTT